MNMNLISPFMMDGTKTSYIRKQTCIFQLLDCESVNDLLPSGMKVLKAKTAHKMFFQWFFLQPTQQANFHYFWRIYRLRHMKNKGVRQSHASPWNSEAIDVWKVALHQPSRRVVVCDNYFFENTIVFCLLQ